MKIAPFAVALVLATSIASSARADDDDVRCSADSNGSTLSLEQAAGKAQGLGYAVKEIKRSKGCWKIEGYDRNGAEIEVRLDPASGNVMKPQGWRAPVGG